MIVYKLAKSHGEMYDWKSHREVGKRISMSKPIEDCIVFSSPHYAVGYDNYYGNHFYWTTNIIEGIATDTTSMILDSATYPGPYEKYTPIGMYRCPCFVPKRKLYGYEINDAEELFKNTYGIWEFHSSDRYIYPEWNKLRAFEDTYKYVKQDTFIGYKPVYMKAHSSQTHGKIKTIYIDVSSYYGYAETVEENDVWDRYEFKVGETITPKRKNEYLLCFRTVEACQEYIDKKFKCFGGNRNQIAIAECAIEKANLCYNENFFITKDCYNRFNIDMPLAAFGKEALACKSVTPINIYQKGE